jgi:hypothetical protein
VQLLLRCLPQQDEIDKLVAFAGNLEQVMPADSTQLSLAADVNPWQNCSSALKISDTWRSLTRPKSFS